MGPTQTGLRTDFRCAVVAHTDRQHMALDLANTVDGQLFLDDGTLRCEGNHRRAWQYLADQPATWGVVLEDDAQPVPDFHHQLTMALTAAPTPIVSLYRGHNVNNQYLEQLGQQATTKAETNNASFITTNQLLHAVAVAIHTNLINDMLRHTHKLPTKFPIDEAISHWANHHPQRPHIAYTHPSLCDHKDGPTVIHQHHRLDKLPRPKGRTAYTTGTRTTWTTKAVTL